MTVATYIYNQRLYWQRMQRFKKYLASVTRSNSYTTSHLRPSENSPQIHLTTPNTPV
jgi:hypothetical protein